MGLFAEAYAGVIAKMAPLLAANRISAVEFEVLMRLARSPEHRLRMTDLAAQAALSTSGATRVVDRLEQAGLVERQTCRSDRRGFFAALTEAGLERVAALLPQHLADIDTWFTGRLTAAQLDDLVATLRVIRDAVRPDAAAGSTGPVPV